MNLTNYEQNIFNNLEQKCEVNTWYKIKEDRPDKEEFIEAIKKHIDVWGTAEFNSDYSKFRTIYHPNSIKWEQMAEYPEQWRIKKVVEL